ncbi:magnesium and cobalt transporter [Rhodovulum imhoffii]|uniref:Magnesium and cobalt transporter n=1 Tax=Rhodovulum imhoffii TaxID=365340 RepID=A0A2T5BSU9_9RHOB|nr:hemolysin family protein [Rhodovulum imhoffii]MBK5932717.1 magnesium/cobalt efflux protein [Rhodovulum imhoffii]PTN02467.1 magnesium and cobalt transporter [Rhodovulum imhoffii]
MGDETEGSSCAAHGAHGSEKTERRGLIGRLASLVRPDSGAQATENDAEGSFSANLAPEAFASGLMNFSSLRVEDVAIPKVEIVAVPADIGLVELVGVFRESGMTRLPVYDGTLDTPLGMVHLKDLSLRYGFNGKAQDFSLDDMIRPLLFAPPSMPVGVLLQKMQSQRMHMALVIDEYGGVDGLVTIEDLVEQVVGEIEDEHDVTEGQFWVQEKPGIYLAQSRAPLDEFEAEIGLKLAEAEDEEEIDTIGGLVFMMIGRVPARGEVIPHDTGAEFEVVDADPRRIKRLRVRLPSAKVA